MILTPIGLSLICALLLKYWKNLSYPKFLPTSTLTIFTILVNQHIVQVSALKQVCWKLLMICSILITKATYLYYPWLTCLQHLITIDHRILLHRLHADFGFTETVLQWFSSYLTDSTHYISLSNHCSAVAPVHSGVPQDSVLGAMLFTMYIRPLSANTHYVHTLYHTPFICWWLSITDVCSPWWNVWATSLYVVMH